MFHLRLPGWMTKLLSTIRYRRSSTSRSVPTGARLIYNDRWCVTGEDELTLFPGTTDVFKLSELRFELSMRVSYLMEQLKMIRNRVDTSNWPIIVEALRIDRYLAMELWRAGEITIAHLENSHNGYDYSIVIPNFFKVPEVDKRRTNDWMIPLVIAPRIGRQPYTIVISGHGEGLLEPFTQKRRLVSVKSGSS